MPNFISPTIPSRIFGRKVVFVFKYNGREYYYDQDKPYLIYGRSIENSDDVIILDSRSDNHEER